MLPIVKRAWHYLADWPDGDDLPPGVIIAVFIILAIFILTRG